MENFNYIEKGPERMPSKEEVLEVISRHIEKNVSQMEKVSKMELTKELSDEQGLYLLEAKVEVAGKSGEFIEYLYMRKGVFPDGNSTEKTTINVLYYADEIPVTGWNIAECASDTGELEDVNIGEKFANSDE